MANLCFTQYTIYGEYKKCVSCLNLFHDYMNLNSSPNWDLKNILIKLGVNYNLFKCTGEIDWIAEQVENNDEWSNFSIDISTKWTPEHDAIKLMLNTFFPELNYCYLSEEPNNLIFETNDTNQYFYDVEYYVNNREKLLKNKYLLEDGPYTEDELRKNLNSMLSIKDKKDINFLLSIVNKKYPKIFIKHIDYCKD